jgi:hypothetical protein
MPYRKLAAILLGLFVVSSAVAQDYRDKAVVDGPVHDNVEVICDLPATQHVKNFGAPKDGKGLCVFASMSMLARWHHVLPLTDVINKVQEGGGWPEKVDGVLKQYSPGTKYIQYEGTDAAILDEAFAERRAACVTYGYGERYNNQTIYHMVLLVHFDKDLACIVDNNFPGTYEWMSRKEFLRRWKHPDGKGWAYTFLVPPPPPIPRGE